MKRPFFLSSLSFLIAAVLANIINVVWPIPADVLIQYTPAAANTWGMLTYVFSGLGLIAFVIGVWNKKWE